MDYKGKLKDTSFREKWFSDEPHYFGFATIEQKPFKDEGSEKADYLRIYPRAPRYTDLQLQEKANS